MPACFNASAFALGSPPKPPRPPRLLQEHELPRITVQLPLFNEMYVVDRLVEAVCRMDYPKDLLEIQILDDYAPQHKNIKPCQYHGSIYCCVPAKRGHTKPAGEWNTEEITCKGSHWKVTVNGAVIVDIDLLTVPGQEALAKRTKGPLGFLGLGPRGLRRGI